MQWTEEYIDRRVAWQVQRVGARGGDCNSQKSGIQTEQSTVQVRHYLAARLGWN